MTTTATTIVVDDTLATQSLSRLPATQVHDIDKKAEAKEAITRQYTNTSLFTHLVAANSVHKAETGEAQMTQYRLGGGKQTATDQTGLPGNAAEIPSSKALARVAQRDAAKSTGTAQPATAMPTASASTPATTSVGAVAVAKASQIKAVATGLLNKTTAVLAKAAPVERRTHSATVARAASTTGTSTAQASGNLTDQTQMVTIGPATPTPPAPSQAQHGAKPV